MKNHALVPSKHEMIVESKNHPFLEPFTIFDPVHKADQAIIKTPFTQIANYFQENGFPESTWPQMTLLILTAISGSLGDPLFTVLYSPDQAQISQTLNIGTQVSPSLREYTDLAKADLLEADRGFFSDRTIVCPSLVMCQKTLPMLNQLVQSGYLKHHTKARTRYGQTTVEVIIEGPTGFITATDNLNYKALYESNALILSIDDEGHTDQPVERYAVPRSSILRKFFSRLTHHQVEIPFFALLTQEAKWPQSISRLLERLLKNITRLNNSAALTYQEMFYDSFFRTESNQPHILPDHGRTLMATKLDYYLLTLLLNSGVSFSAYRATDEERRVTEALKEHNTRYLRYSTVSSPADLESESYVVKTLHTLGSQRAWGTKHNIQNIIERTGSERLSLTKIDSLLETLSARGSISSMRAPNTIGEMIYSIRDFSSDKKILLPSPSSVYDPVYEGRSVKVCNPFSKETIEI